MRVLRSYFEDGGQPHSLVSTRAGMWVAVFVLVMLGSGVVRLLWTPVDVPAHGRVFIDDAYFCRLLVTTVTPVYTRQAVPGSETTRHLHSRAAMATALGVAVFFGWRCGRRWRVLLESEDVRATPLSPYWTMLRATGAAMKRFVSPLAAVALALATVDLVLFLNLYPGYLEAGRRNHDAVTNYMVISAVHWATVWSFRILGLVMAALSVVFLMAGGLATQWGRVGAGFLAMAVIVPASDAVLDQWNPMTSISVLAIVGAFAGLVFTQAAVELHGRARMESAACNSRSLLVRTGSRLLLAVTANRFAR